jgi:hypothetical protein
MYAKILIIQSSTINPLSYLTQRPSVEINKLVVKLVQRVNNTPTYTFCKSKILAQISYKGNDSTTSTTKVSKAIQLQTASERRVPQDCLKNGATTQNMDES